MKSNRFIQKVLAIVLLLVFGQKTGAELYFHNWLHTSNYQQALPQAPSGNVVSYSCNCFDDFAMPFAEPTAEITSSVIRPHQVYFSTFIQPHSFSFLFFNSLKAPANIARIL